jgi:hypothetical protein
MRWQRISWLDEWLSSSQEGLFSMALQKKKKIIWSIWYLTSCTDTQIIVIHFTIYSILTIRNMLTVTWIKIFIITFFRVQIVKNIINDVLSDMQLLLHNRTWHILMLLYIAIKCNDNPHSMWDVLRTKNISNLPENSAPETYKNVNGIYYWHFLRGMRKTVNNPS